jgi:hypothetical protein
MSNDVVLIAGALANKPFNGGNAWTRLNWLLGFRRLGFEPHFVEEISSATCVDADGRPSPPRDSINAIYFRDVMKQFGFESRASLICDGTRALVGADVDQLEALARRADILLNISGHLQLPALKLAPRRKLYLDDDPGYTQFWQATGQLGTRLRGHDYYFTLGASIGSSGCTIPTGGIRWQKARVPIVLAEWPPVFAERFHQFTTVAAWRGPFGTVCFDGKTYGPKAHAFRKFLDLPGKTGLKFQLVLDIHEADWKDREALVHAGWDVASAELAATPDRFRDYVQKSSAEFSVAQPIYVETGSGWFSDRSAAYLASGKPTLIQDTGLSQHLPTGDGLLAFTTLEQAIEGAHNIVSRYAHHARSARALAEEYFDSDKVLDTLLCEIAFR